MAVAVIPLSIEGKCGPMDFTSSQPAKGNRMDSLFHACQTMLPYLLVILLLAGAGGCTKAGNKNPAAVQQQQAGLGGLSQKLSALDSASCYLAAGELDKFQPGRAMDELLEDVQWRGRLYMTAEHRGQSVSWVTYEVLSGDPNEENGVWVEAIFVDGKFVKFVNRPPRLPEDEEVAVTSRGKPWRRPKPLKAGDTRFLVRALDSDAVSITDLKEEVESKGPPPKQRVDPGLTAAFLVLKAMGAVPGPSPPATDQDFERNAALRDQFNAARLRVGMTEAQVEAVLKAEPMESGKVEAGIYRIYGSNESFNIQVWLHFSNVLVIYREGKAIAIGSVSAGNDWRQKLGQATADLPAPPGG